MNVWYAQKLVALGDLPQPRTTPTVEYAGSAPVRVLLVGNGPAHGWGVASHDLALTGGLARAISSRTGRGVRVDFVGEEAMSAEATPAWLRRATLASYDASVVVVGMNDAVRLTPIDSWTSSMLAVLDVLRDGLPDEAPVQVAEVHRVRSVPPFDSLLGNVAQRHADRMNVATRDLVGEIPQVSAFVLGEPSARHAGSIGNRAMYEEWAEVIADVLVPTLPAPPGFGSPVESQASGNPWPGLHRAKELASAGVETELTRITAAARKAFRVPVAGVSLVADGVVHYLGKGQPVAIPSEYSHCAHVVDSAEPLVVQSSSFDPRFRGNPVISLTKGEFYAGHPLFSSTGEPIGSFCLMGTAPRPMGPGAMARLEEFATRAQAELWKLEALESETDASRTSVA